MTSWGELEDDLGDSSRFIDVHGRTFDRQKLFDIAGQGAMAYGLDRLVAGSTSVVADADEGVWHIVGVDWSTNRPVVLATFHIAELQANWPPDDEDGVADDA